MSGFWILKHNFLCFGRVEGSLSAHSLTLSISANLVSCAHAGMIMYVSSAYFIRLSLTTLKSHAAITYDAGPTPEPSTILAVIVFSVDT